jgi:hypothetical protein
MPMGKVVFETDYAIFEFDGKAVRQIIGRESPYDLDLDEINELSKRLSTDSDAMIVIPDDRYYFAYVALDLIEAGEGSATCIACGKTYRVSQLKPIKVGCGPSPLDIKPEKRGGIKRLFRWKPKPPEKFGGKGYSCPEGHDLISVSTWKTFV